MTIGELIKTRREALDLTLEEVGRSVGVSRATVSRWESGDIHRMKIDKIAALAQILHLDPALFVMPTEVLSSDEYKLLYAYRGAEESARKIALEILENHQKTEGNQ